MSDEAKRISLDSISFDILCLLAEFTIPNSLLALRLCNKRFYMELSSPSCDVLWKRKRTQLGLPSQDDIGRLKFTSDRWFCALAVGSCCFHCGGFGEVWRDQEDRQIEQIQYSLCLKLCGACVRSNFVNQWTLDSEADESSKRALQIAKLYSFYLGSIPFQSLFGSGDSEPEYYEEVIWGWKPEAPLPFPWPSGTCIYQPAFFLSQWKIDSYGDEREKEKHFWIMKSRQELKYDMARKIVSWRQSKFREIALNHEAIRRVKFEKQSLEFTTQMTALGYTEDDFNSAGFTRKFEYFDSINRNVEPDDPIWLERVLPPVRLELECARVDRRLIEGEEGLMNLYLAHLNSSLNSNQRRGCLSAEEFFDLSPVKQFLLYQSEDYSNIETEAIPISLWPSAQNLINSFQVAAYQHVYSANQIILSHCLTTLNSFPLSIQKSFSSTSLPRLHLALVSTDEASRQLMEKVLFNYSSRLLCLECTGMNESYLYEYMQDRACFCRIENNVDSITYYGKYLTVNPASVLAVKLLLYSMGIRDDAVLDKFDWEGKRKEERWTCSDCFKNGINFRNPSTKFLKSRGREGCIGVRFDRMVTHLVNHHFISEPGVAWLPPEIHFDTVEDATKRFVE